MSTGRLQLASLARHAAMPVQLLFDGHVIGRTSLPQLEARAGVDNNIDIVSTVSVSDIESFNLFGVALINQASVTMTMLGQATVTATIAGSSITLPSVRFEKSVTMNGCGGLPLTRVVSFSLAGSNATAINAALTVEVYNPSVAAIEPLGDLGNDVYYENSLIGRMYAKNLSLGRGWTSIDLTGTLVNNNSTVTETLISGYLGGLWMNATAYGVALPSSTPLYAGVIPEVVLAASLPPSSLPLVESVDVTAMTLSPETNTLLGVALNATITLNNPLGAESPIVTSAIRLNVSLQGQGEDIGMLVVPWTNVVGGMRELPGPAGSRVNDPGPALFNLSVALEATLDIGATGDAFGAFLSDFVYAREVTIGLYGPTAAAMSATIDCALGRLTVSVPITSTSFVPGIDSFPGVTVQVWGYGGAAHFADSTLPPSPSSLVRCSRLL